MMLVFEEIILFSAVFEAGSKVYILISYSEIKRRKVTPD